MFLKEHYTWDKFLWACELWYSNGLKILFPDDTIKTSLVPILGLLNHGVWLCSHLFLCMSETCNFRSSLFAIKKAILIFQLCPHITRFSKIDWSTGKLILSSVRPCKSGEQCFLNYGSLSNSHLLTFYGFILDKNPFDILPIGMSFSLSHIKQSWFYVKKFDFYCCITDLDFSDDSDISSLLDKWKLGNSHMIRGCWFSTSHLSPFGLPTRLLAALRIALMEEDEVKQLSIIPRYKKVKI